MSQIKLIEHTDFLPYRAIAGNVDAMKRIDPHVLEAQKMDLAPALGASLYFDLLKYTTSRRAGEAAAAANQPPTVYTPTDNEVIFERLLNGVEYTIHAGTDKEVTIIFEGIIPVLVYFSYARFVTRDNIRSTPTGFVHKKTLESEPISQKELQQEAERARNDAAVYMQSVHKYIADRRYIYDGAVDWFKRYGQDCCGGGFENGFGCKTKRPGSKMTAIRNGDGMSRNWNRRER